MHREPGEKRDFLPSFVAALDAAGAERIAAERGYGSGMAIDESEYSAASSKLVFRDRVDCLAQEAVMQVRCMDEEDFELLRPGTVLLTMLHYTTRPDRVRRLAERRISGISLDGLIDDRGRGSSKTLPLWRTTEWRRRSMNWPRRIGLSTIRSVPRSE